MIIVIFECFVIDVMSFEDIQVFFFVEVCVLDDCDWDIWLIFYYKDCLFWMFVWDDFDMLMEDLQNEMFLMYYFNKQGIEDCVFWIKIDWLLVILLLELCMNYYLLGIEVLSCEGSEIKLCFNW